MRLAQKKKEEDATIRCLRIMLRPVLKFCLHQAIGVREVLELAKSLLVELAAEELEKQGEAVNTSKISIMTGVHRRDVTKLNEDSDEVVESSNLITKIIGQWEQDSRFTTKAKQPRVLEYEGRQSEFKDLVNSVSADTNSYTVLHELDRLGFIKTTNGRVKLLRTAYIPTGQVEESSLLLSTDVADLLTAGYQNIFEKVECSNLHAKTEYDNIPVSALPKIRKWFLEQGSAFHKRARKYLSKFDRDVDSTIDKEEARARVALGTFSLTEEFDRA